MPYMYKALVLFFISFCSFICITSIPLSLEALWTLQLFSVDYYFCMNSLVFYECFILAFHIWIQTSHNVFFRTNSLFMWTFSICLVMRAQSLCVGLKNFKLMESKFLFKIDNLLHSCKSQSTYINSFVQ